MATTIARPSRMYIDHQETLSELAAYIRKHRPECPPWETARLLLEYDRPDHAMLVGVDHEGEKAVFYHEADRYAIAVPFELDGLADGGAEIADL